MFARASKTGLLSDTIFAVEKHQPNRRMFLTGALWLPGTVGAAPQNLSVRAKRKPSDAWVDYPTRSLAQLRGFQKRRTPVCPYGGRLDRSVSARGFFYPTQQNGRWWLVDPHGHLFLHIGVCSTAPGRSKNNQAALARKFGTVDKWAAETVRLLRANGFNGTGGWSDIESLRSAPERLPYTVSANFLSTFGRDLKLTFQQPGHTGYRGDAIPVFHPQFPEFCERYAQTVVDAAKDPYLIGYFSDNELPAPRDWLDKHLQLDPADPATRPSRRAAEQWLAQRKGGRPRPEDVNDDDREEFRGFVYARYLSVTTAALRKADPNHLCLGPRLHGASLRSAAIFRAAGKYLDVIAVNIYGQWAPASDMLEMWRKEAGKPFLVTEFYAKGEDSGFPNTTGAGWLVPTQRDRALFYHHFVLGCLESKMCVGWHWFKYMDNDPEDLTTDPSNRDSNKGIVRTDYTPYGELLEGMKEFNENVYAVVDWMDRRSPSGRG